MTDLAEFEEWGDRQFLLSAEKMAEAVSATTLVKHRPGFGQTVRPLPGSVVAAIGDLGSESDPDYFFHWLRDSAAIMDAGRVLIQHGIDADGWRKRFAEFIDFSLVLQKIDGEHFAHTVDLHALTRPELRQFLRPEAELAGVKGESVQGDVRYNADGTIDFLRWGRPQYDGPAARALTCLRFLTVGAVPDDAREPVAQLVRLDLGYTRDHASAPCFDIWEEEFGLHYYTCLLQHAALSDGADWARDQGTHEEEEAFASAAAEVGKRLDGFWSEEDGYIRSRIMPPDVETTKALDLSVVLGVLHAGRSGNHHAITDLRVHRTLKRLEAVFAEDYALNREAGAPLAFGRYRGDQYFSGGAWFLTSFGAAEFYYKLAAARSAPELAGRGDAILAFARNFIPETGEISEQFDQTTGEQTSARGLAWSYAAFITAWDARRTTLDHLGADWSSNE